MTTSASFMASGMPPWRPSLLVIWHKLHLCTYSALRVLKVIAVLAENAFAINHDAFAGINAPAKD